MSCGYECFVIGGPWISTNPACPVHGIDKEPSYSYTTRELLEELIDCWDEILLSRELSLTLSIDFGDRDSIEYHEKTSIPEAKERLKRLKQEIS